MRECVSVCERERKKMGACVHMFVCVTLTNWPASSQPRWGRTREEGVEGEDRQAVTHAGFWGSSQHRGPGWERRERERESDREEEGEKGRGERE